MALTDAQKKQQERHAEYWRKREAENLASNLKEERAYEKELNRIYKDMLDGCQAEINTFYARYADKEGITIADAKKRVRKIDMASYERKAERYVKAANADMKIFGRDYKNSPGAAYYFSDKANEEMRLYNLTMKVNRLEMLKANIGLELIKGSAELETFMEDILQGRTEDELKRQAGILGKTIRNNAQVAHAIVNASFHNAKFSDRVWANHAQMKADLSKLLEQGLIAGKNPRALSKDLQKYFIGEPRLKNGRKGAVHAAERLMRTELARVQTEAQRQSLIRNGFTMYTFVTNTGCCPICAAISDKHFMVKDMLPGKNAPPMHPYCRCSIAAYDESEDYHEWLDFLEAGGKTEEWNKLSAEKKEQFKQKTEKRLENSSKNAKISSGAISGAYTNENDPYGRKRDKSAEDYYREVRNRDRTAEIKAVAKNSGFAESDVDKIFAHIFELEHLFNDGSIHRFHADYYMQHSWMRLRDGKNIQKHDIFMLHHELMEANLMGTGTDVVYEEAHKTVEKKYNYKKELLEYLKDHDA